MKVNNPAPEHTPDWEYQGKRPDQVESSEKILFYIIIVGSAIACILSLWYIASNFLEAIKYQPLNT